MSALKYKELKELCLDLEDCGSQEMTVMLGQDKSHLSKDWGVGSQAKLDSLEKHLTFSVN